MTLRARWQSALGAISGILLAGGLLVSLPGQSVWVMAAIGSSAVILFVQPHSPLAQPWSVLGGYLVATICGLLAGLLIPVPVVAGAIGLGGAVLVMIRLRCLHPPGGAIVLLVAAEGVSSWARAASLFVNATANAVLLLTVAWLINNHLLGRRYPQCLPDEAAPQAARRNRSGLQHEDLEAALAEEDGFVDVQETDLVNIYDRAVRHAVSRHMEMVCADLMVRAPATVEFGTPLDEAWQKLHGNPLKALPVLDRFGRVIGIVTMADFLRSFQPFERSAAVGFLDWLRPTPGSTSTKPEVVGQIMTENVIAASEDTQLAALAEQFSLQGLYTVPVVDERKKLVGMITKSDFVRALYRQLALVTAG